eukprot:TRINITY_DN1997_c0_g1_i2.p1 TRINITY_DN1997_c0_g1~~TRINITY_DN1997_c0_g1_i2.p1  ORF type:complete len:139 (+),score=62.96 TRINITY_DN1997_c0_g1_i2:85-501(+)
MLPKFITDFGLEILLLAYGYKSFKAIESDDKSDDTQWLTFWLIFAIVNFVEIWSDLILSWVPFYNEAKLGLMVFLGFFKGASLIYENGIRPFLKKHEGVIDAQIEDSIKKADALKKKALELAKEKGAKAVEEVKKKLG